MATLRELRKEASTLGIKKYSRMTKSQLERAILNHQIERQLEHSDLWKNRNTGNILPSQIEHNENARADDSAGNTENVQQESSQPDTASASQSAAVVSTESETSAQPERKCSRGYFRGTRYKTFFDKIAFISRFIDIDTFLLTVQQGNTLTTCTANYSWKKGIAFIAGDKRNDFLSPYRLIEAGMPSNVKFEVGKTYGGKYKITARTDDTISYSVAGENLTGEAIILNIYDNSPKNNHHGDEYFYPSFSGLSCKCIYARDISPDTLPEDSQPDALYDDDSFSDSPGDNSDNARNQDFPVDIPECTHAEITQQVLPAPVDNNPLHHLKPCPACHSTHIPFLKRCDDNNFSTATRRFNGGIARQHIYYRLKCRDCGHEVIATIFRSVGDGFVIPHQNEADVKKKVFQNWDSQYTDNPGFTIVPSEHISRPDYATYPDTIQDECPYVTVHACNFPKHNTAAAVVPYDQAASIRKFFHIIALYFRLWLAMNISRRDIAISMPVIVPATVNDITPQQPTKKECATASAHDDIEHKLIDTKDLHFAEKRKALDHNATVITSCMFPEAVISLLMSISAKAILQLGFHMRLFIAKPKGTKKVIAELFANRLIDSRKSRANVRTKSGNFTAKSPANIPYGVKFFVGAKRQICFKFDDSQLDLPFDD